MSHVPHRVPACRQGRRRGGRRVPQVCRRGARSGRAPSVQVNPVRSRQARPRCGRCRVRYRCTFATSDIAGLSDPCSQASRANQIWRACRGALGLVRPTPSGRKVAGPKRKWSTWRDRLSVIFDDACNSSGRTTSTPPCSTSQLTSGSAERNRRSRHRSTSRFGVTWVSRGALRRFRPALRYAIAAPTSELGSLDGGCAKVSPSFTDHPAHARESVRAATGML